MGSDTKTHFKHICSLVQLFNGNSTLEVADYKVFEEQ